MHDLVAQLVEHNTFNVRVLGSSPSQVTDFITEKVLIFKDFFITRVLELVDRHG